MKFKKGDRVIVIDNTILPIYYNELRGTVLLIEGHDWVYVKFDSNVNGHDLNGLCENGYGWICPENSLKLDDDRLLKLRNKVLGIK